MLVLIPAAVISVGAFFHGFVEVPFGGKARPGTMKRIPAMSGAGPALQRA